jgi:hypothetical protein
MAAPTSFVPLRSFSRPWVIGRHRLLHRRSHPSHLWSSLTDLRPLAPDLPHPLAPDDEPPLIDVMRVMPMSRCQVVAPCRLRPAHYYPGCRRIRVVHRHIRLSRVSPMSMSPMQHWHQLHRRLSHRLHQSCKVPHRRVVALPVPDPVATGPASAPVAFNPAPSVHAATPAPVAAGLAPLVCSTAPDPSLSPVPTPPPLRQPLQVCCHHPLLRSPPPRMSFMSSPQRITSHHRRSIPTLPST